MLESYRHRGEKIGPWEVEGLTGLLNGKTDRVLTEGLARELAELRGALAAQAYKLGYVTEVFGEINEAGELGLVEWRRALRDRLAVCSVEVEGFDGEEGFGIIFDRIELGSGETGTGGSQGAEPVRVAIPYAEPGCAGLLSAGDYDRLNEGEMDFRGLERTLAGKEMVVTDVAFEGDAEGVTARVTRQWVDDDENHKIQTTVPQGEEAAEEAGVAPLAEVSEAGPGAEAGPESEAEASEPGGMVPVVPGVDPGEGIEAFGAKEVRRRLPAATREQAGTMSAAQVVALEGKADRGEEFDAYVGGFYGVTVNGNGTYGVNGVTLTFEEMQELVRLGVPSNSTLDSYFVNSTARTHLWLHIRLGVAVGDNTFLNSKMEYAGHNLLVPGTRCFSGCRNLRRAIVYAPRHVSRGADAWLGCEALEDIDITGTVYAASISLEDSPRINLATLQRIVERTPEGGEALHGYSPPGCLR